jgi:hypothetical protein
MKSHRLTPNENTSADVYGVGADDRVFPTGVNHVVNHTVAGSHPLPETKVGDFIKDVGDAPGVFHGVAPTSTRTEIESEYDARQKEATFVSGVDTIPNYYPNPVPVVVVPNRVGSTSIKTFNAVSYTIPNDHPIMIVPRNYSATRVVIQNEDATNFVRIARVPANASQGFMIAAGKSLEIFTQDTVSIVADTAPVKVSVLVEYGVDE